MGKDEAAGKKPGAARVGASAEEGMNTVHRFSENVAFLIQKIKA